MYTNLRPTHTYTQVCTPCNTHTLTNMHTHTFFETHANLPYTHTHKHTPRNYTLFASAHFDRVCN